MKRSVLYKFRIIRRTVWAGFFVLGIIISCLLSGCGYVSGAEEEAYRGPKPAAEDFLDTALPVAKEIAIVIDTSDTSLEAFAEEVREEIAKHTAAWFPKRPGNIEEKGALALPGLRIVIYLVNSVNPQDIYDPLNIHLVIDMPGIPGIESRPLMPDDVEGAEFGLFMQEYAAWKEASGIWDAAYTSALASAQEASAEIMDMDLTVRAAGYASGINNAVCAALGATRGDEVVLLVASDLLENGKERAVPPSGKTGRAVLIVFPPDGDEVSARKLADDYGQTLLECGFSADIFFPVLLREATGEVFE